MTGARLRRKKGRHAIQFARGISSPAAAACFALANRRCLVPSVPKGSFEWALRTFGTRAIGQEGAVFFSFNVTNPEIKRRT